MALIADYAEDELHNVDLETGFDDLRRFGLDSLGLMSVILEIGDSLDDPPSELTGTGIATIGDLVNIVKRRRLDMQSREARTPQRVSGVRAQDTFRGRNGDHGLQVNRTGIVFRNVDAKRVRIEVTVTNTSAHPTPRTPMRLQAAPLGAFLPWRDLTAVWVPSLEPGASVTVETEVRSPRPRALGRFDRVPPQRLLASLGMSDEEDRPQQTTERNKTLTGGLFRRWLRRWQATDSSSSPTLPPDPADLLGQSNPHWAGNINVLIGHTAVERHRAAALKIYAGRTNVAALFVGDGRVDQYRFELSGQGAEWNTRLTDFRELPNLRRRGPIHELKLGSWLSVPRRYSIAVLIEPPDYVAAGELKVHVTRKSTGETAIVEFSLDPKAQGPGCYAL